MRDSGLRLLLCTAPEDVVPKILALDPSTVAEPYLAWLRSVARPG